MTDRKIDADAVARARRSRASGQLTLGVALLVVGVVITAVTYGSATGGGGTYIIAYGPIIVGVIKVIRGLSNLNS